MIIESFRNYDPSAKIRVVPKDILNENFGRMHNTIRVLRTLKPEIEEEYISYFRQGMEEEIGNYNIDVSKFDLDSISKDIAILDNEYPEFKELITRLVFKYLHFPEGSEPNLEPFDGIWVEALKGWMLVPYVRTKAFLDVLGREDGIAFWKKMVDYIYDELEEKSDEEIWPPIPEVAENWLKGLKSGENRGFDVTVVKYDDYKMLLKIDRCCVHEALKHMEDQELVRLSRCYSGNADARTKRVRRKTISQTLHCGEYCDEFYFDSSVHPDATQPPAEFTKRLGKEDSAKLIEEYKDKSE